MIQAVKNSLIVFAMFFISMSVMAQKKINDNWIDWANFKRYEAENNKVTPLLNSENRVVFMGNSIFEGWIRLRPEFFSGKPYFDRGISGQTTPQMLLRMYDDVIALQPDIMVLKAGINDIAENNAPYNPDHTLDNIKAMAQLARFNKIKVILCSVLPASDFKWRPGLAPGDKVIALNEAIKKFATENKFYYLDLYSTVVDDNKGMRKEYASDGVHPTLEGYKVMEPLLEEAIRKVRK
jgi:lysophospholipase L1-like esterase